MKISILQKQVHRNAVEKGFWNRLDGSLIAEKLCLIHSEVSEALEALRENKTIDEELADIVIRVMDLAEMLSIDLEEEIINKHQINVNRPYKHNKLF